MDFNLVIGDIVGQVFANPRAARLVDQPAGPFLVKRGKRVPIAQIGLPGRVPQGPGYGRKVEGKFKVQGYRIPGGQGLGQRDIEAGPLQANPFDRGARGPVQFL